MSTLNVFRYAALIAGVAYGFTTDLSLKAAAAKKAEEKEFQKKVALIAEAKAEYKKLHAKPAAASGSFNLEDPNLDFAQAITNAIASLDA
ncbi:F1F0 ATP synthase subunit E [Martiniozyma asiatica (nom. inval.)]|nr:F1F0 ATP synthase subunit E [Martiniozyma asiatica]